MLLSVFAIYDSGISTWLCPVFSRNKGEMMRQFIDIVNSSDSKLAKYPGDFTLFELGTFDDNNCQFNLFPTPVRVGGAIEFVKPVVSSGGVS